MTAYDVLVVGSGPGGYITAIRAAQLGFKTGIVEREYLGGICLNWGCIPTKSFLHSAELFEHAKKASKFGLKLEGTITAPIEGIVARSRSVSARLNRGVGYLLAKNSVDIIWGQARLSSAGEVTVASALAAQASLPKGVQGPGSYSAKHVILATGARPRALPFVKSDGKLIWTYFDALKPDALPGSLIVVGAGAIGIEFASFYRSLGSDVTVIESLDRIMPNEDAEVSAFAREALQKRGIKILTGANMTQVKKTAASVDVHVSAADGRQTTISGDRLLVAIGVEGNIEDLGLEAIGVETARGCVVTDEFGRTNVPGLYAIGDVAGPPFLAHKAEHEGVICVEKIAALPDVHALEKDKIPACTFGNPNVASVGLTEARARESGRELLVGRFPLMANGKAITLGQDEGLVKTILDKDTGEILGAHMVGNGVTELIHGYVVAMNPTRQDQAILGSVFPHPTVSEAVKESVLNAHGRTLNF